MTKDEALRIALEALETSMYPQQKQLQAITAVKAALEEKDEPMEFFDWYDNAHWGNEDFKEGCHRAWNAAIKYTAKPNQEAKDEFVATLEDLEQEIYENTRQFVSLDVMEWMLKRYYTTPPKRKPLTLGQKQRLWSSVGDKPTLKDRVNAYGLAIEAAHGIKGEA